MNLVFDTCTIITHKVEDTGVALGIVIGFGLTMALLGILIMIFGGRE